MKKTKRSLVAGVALPLALILAACGGGDGGDGNDGSGGASSDEGGASGESDELTVWTWDPAFNIYAMEEAERIFQEENPDFKLNIVETPWDDLQPKLTTIAQAQQLEELPDIFLVQNNAFQKNVINYPELFSDLDGSGVDFSEFPGAVVDYSVVDGVNYGVPFDAGTAVGAYRTDLLAEADLTIEDFTDISWAEFIELGKQVKDVTGKAMFAGEAGEAQLIMMIMQSAGESLFDAEGNPTIVDNDTLTKTVETYRDLVTEGVLLEVNSWDEYISSFTNDQVVGTINGIWIAGSIQTAEDQAGDWAITNVPRLDDVPSATNYTANGGSSWAISSVANAELAQEFLNATFAGSVELYDTILPEAGAIANWIPAGGTDVYGEEQEFFGGQPIYQMVVEFGEDVPSNNTGVYYYEGQDSVSAALTQVIQGSDIDTALEEAQSRVEFEME